MNEDILKDFKMDPVDKISSHYKQKWLHHVSRMEDIRCSKQLPDYRPVGRSDLDDR